MTRRRVENSPRYRRRRLIAAAVLGMVVVAAVAVWVAGCDSQEDVTGDEEPLTTTGAPSGDIEGRAGEEIRVGDVRITVKALQAAFRPAHPVHRLSGETPSSPGPEESLYQAYVRVENDGVSPVRIDPRDFSCLFGDAVAPVEPTLSGPLPRSLLKNTSFDLILTFKWVAGYEPVLLYTPPWHEGTIRIKPAPEEEATE